MGTSQEELERPRLGAGSLFTLEPERALPTRGSAGAVKEIAVVGAGRWGRILCEVLSALAPAVAKIRLVASRNHAEATTWLAQRQAAGDLGQVVLANSLDELIEQQSVRAAIVARLSCDHYDTARRLLDAGIHVLVEKPFVRTADEARALIALADARELRLAVGYEFMYSRAMHHFRELIHEHVPVVQSVRSIWTDVSGVKKWGIVKQPDPSMNVVGDVYPHTLSQLQLLFGEQPIALQGLQSTDGARRARIELTLGKIDVQVVLDKNTPNARRSISVRGTNGQMLELDYSVEPGWVELNGTRLPPDRHAQSYAPSLAGEMVYFIAHIGNPNLHIPNDANKTLPIVEATAEAERALNVRQTELLRGLLYQQLPTKLPAESIAIARQHLVGPLLQHGLIDNPKDSAALDTWVERALRTAHTFSAEPWTTQTEIGRREKLDTPTLLRLNAAMRDTDLVQDLIVENGLAKKYWQTILPLVRSGSIEAVLTDSYSFPVRIGIYAAISCMFHCSFCGRDADARYSHSEVDNGNRVFDALFASMAADGRSTFSLGGGLEPLTNPKIDDVIYSAKAHHLRVPLVTNGYMLTSKFISRHPGLFDLDVLRVSLYGVDDDSYLQVTRRKDAFTPVKENAITFLKERNRRGASVKYGFNFVVLMNSTDQVLRVLDVIREINAAVDNGPGVDFLTLREDFSVPEEAGLSAEERAHLVDVFERFKTKHLTDCPELEVDYGYALHALAQGIVWKPLAMVKADGMYPKAYPQVSVAIDILGDVYLYRDAAFLNRPGADRYIIGRVSATRTLEDVIQSYLASSAGIVPKADDPALMDAFDHVVTKTIWQGRADIDAGIPFNLGPVRARVYDASNTSASSAATKMNYWERLDSMQTVIGNKSD